MDQNTDWLIEFIHDYDEGYFVTKRGLDATPVVVKKFDLAVGEVMAFTCHQRANKALTAFHFHPDFPPEDRPEYMRRHAKAMNWCSASAPRLRRSGRRNCASSGNGFPGSGAALR